MSDALKTVPTMDLLREKRDQILAIAAKYGAMNVRVFGSVARDEAQPTSDIDLLVTVRKGVGIFELVGLWQDLQELLGRNVSLVTDGIQDKRFLARIQRDLVDL